VTRLRLTGFRSYQRLGLELDGRPVVLVGANGAGKTNLLEAVSLLTPGRGLRRARLDDLGYRAPAAPAGADWAIAATVATADGPVEIGTGVVADAASEATERRLVRIDGAPARSQTALGRLVSAIWLTPEMDRLFVEGRSARRRFLDRLVFGFDAPHARRLNAYERAMAERNRLLRDSRATGRAPDAAWLEALEGRMAEDGVAVAAARRALVERLGAACALRSGPFPAAEIALDGVVEGWLAAAPALAVEDRMRAGLAAARPDDAAAGRATLGVHRSDLVVRHAAKGVGAAHCSTGEQKALLISIVLADARLQGLERGTAPLVLLDEIAAHLDAPRRHALFDEVTALGAQAWMTGTDAATFAPLGAQAQHLRIVDGRVAAAPPDLS
jgi:DNA replication and repair protein RecF